MICKKSYQLHSTWSVFRLESVTVDGFIFVGTNFRGLNKNDTFVGFKIRGHSVFFHNSYRNLPFRGYLNSWIGPSKKTRKIWTPQNLSHSQYLCKCLTLTDLSQRGLVGNPSQGISRHCGVKVKHNETDKWVEVKQQVIDYIFCTSVQQITLKPQYKKNIVVLFGPHIDRSGAYRFCPVCLVVSCQL